MLIFYRFPSRKKAEAYAMCVTEKYGRSATVYDTQEQSAAVDPFPFRLLPPIVLVERDEELTLEDEIAATVKRYGGKFAGT
jgi:hypothetical protein